MGRAEELFHRIEQGGLAAVNALIDDRASEELFLEFKRSTDDGQGTRLHDRDRTNLRKAIGGFANSEGGVIVWGIDCSKDLQLGDVASAKMPLTNPKRFASWLEGAVSGCTVPPVIGVRSIAVPQDATTGFVVTYVPQSFHAPHQIANEGKYLIRAGSDFVPAPHGVVAGLFGIPPHPVVSPNYLFHQLEFPQEYVRASVTIMLVNVGQVVAEDLFVSLMAPGAPKQGQGVSLDGVTNWPVASGVDVDRSWVCPRDFRLAPGGFVHVAKIRLILAESSITDFRCIFTAGCRGAIPHRQELFVSSADLDETLADIFNAKRTDDSTFDFMMASQKLLGLANPI